MDKVVEPSRLFGFLHTCFVLSFEEYYWIVRKIRFEFSIHIASNNLS